MKNLVFWFIQVLLLSSGMVIGQTAQDYLPEKYHKEWKDLYPRLNENIERYRKGDAMIKLVDNNGIPITGATLDIQQKTHDFLFGCNILVLGQMGSLNETYEQEFVKLFNLATTTFCWGAMEPEPGKLRFKDDSEEVWRRPPPDRVVAFGKKYGISLKGQPLLAGSWHPTWAPNDPVEAKKLYEEWFSKVAEQYGEDFLMFDLVNESQCHRDFCLYTPDLEYVDWAFDATKKIFPEKTILAINEAGNYAHEGSISEGKNVYFNQLKMLFDQGKGQGIDAIGFQFHLFEQLKPHIEGKYLTPDTLLNIYNTFGELKRPLYITEITIPANLEWQGNRGEAIQAEVLSNLYRLWFSIPAMAGIVYWNLPDGAAWKEQNEAKAGLLDECLREKPSYQALYQLINREWTTNLSKQTNIQGKVDFRGFWGKYDVKVTIGSKTETFEIDLLKEKENSFLLTFN